MIEKFISPNEPIELAGLSINNKQFNLEEPVLTGKTWLKDLSLSVKNTSKKPIVYMYIGLEAAPSGKMKFPMLAPLTFGPASLKSPGLVPAAERKSQNDPSLEKLMPGDTAKISVTPKTYDWILRFMENNQVTDIERVKIFFEFVLFDDDIAWSKGAKMKRNPKNPNRWDVVDEWKNEDGLLRTYFLLEKNRYSFLPAANTSSVSFPANADFF